MAGAKGLGLPAPRFQLVAPGPGQFIHVGLSKPYILEHRNQLVIKTLQRYESNKHVDYGVKMIYAVSDGDSFKILREEWAPAEPPRLSAQDSRR